MLNSLLQTWTISLGLDKGGHCHELFLRGKRFLSQPITRIHGKKPSSSRKILPDFYRLRILPESEPKNLPVAQNLPTGAVESKHPQETYLPPMSRTRLPVHEVATNLQLFSLGNFLHGSSVMQVPYRQTMLDHRPVGLFEGAMAMPEQGLEPPMSRIKGSTQFSPYFLQRTRKLSLGDIVRESRTMQSQQEESPYRVWARQGRPLYK
jgi:hypothetical protein